MRNKKKMNKLAEAAQSSIPFNALDVSLSDVVHPDSGTAESRCN
jgi:hypothetical protein